MRRKTVSIPVLALPLAITAGLFAQEKPAEPVPPAQPPVTLTEAEQAFSSLLTKATLVGRFSVQGRDTPPKPERYAINSVSKLGGDKWLVVARVTYGDYDLPVPVPVSVLWAGDTPVLQVTDLTIPGLGEGFTSRVMFYGDRYAGTWQHGKAGGHMWGMIEKEQSDSDANKQNSSAPAPRSNGNSDSR